MSDQDHTYPTTTALRMEIEAEEQTPCSEEERREIQREYWPQPNCTPQKYRAPTMMSGSPEESDWKQVMIFPLLCFQYSYNQSEWHIQTLPWDDGGMECRMDIKDEATIACLELMPADKHVVN